MPLTVVLWTLGFADAQRYWLIIANLFFNHHRTTSYCGSPWEMPYSLVYLCKAVSPLRECFSEHLLLSFLLFIEHLKCGVIVVQSHSLVSLWPPELKHVKLPHLSPSPGLCSNSCPLSRWCHPTILSSDLLAVQETLKNLLPYHSSKASILWCSAFFMVQLPHMKKP